MAFMLICPILQAVTLSQITDRDIIRSSNVRENNDIIPRKKSPENSQKEDLRKKVKKVKELIDEYAKTEQGKNMGNLFKEIDAETLTEEELNELLDQIIRKKD
ncbi:hypothetical protein X975_26996, partial [Stegodyphus mimosarum]